MVKETIVQYIKEKFNINIPPQGNTMWYGSKSIFNTHGLPMVLNILVGDFCVKLNTIHSKHITIDYSNPNFFEIFNKATESPGPSENFKRLNPDIDWSNYG